VIASFWTDDLFSQNKDRQGTRNLVWVSKFEINESDRITRPEITLEQCDHSQGSQQMTRKNNTGLIAHHAITTDTQFAEDLPVKTSIKQKIIIHEP